MNNKTNICMWSYPRSTSTALMKSFLSRGDTHITDEPLYGYFLKKTGIKHPDYQNIITTYNVDYNSLIKYLSNLDSINKNVWYQKHMAHHIFRDDNLIWLNRVNNCFLIRDPMKVIISYSKIFKEITPELLGFPQMLRIFNYVKANSNDSIPFVINSSDLLMDPKRILSKLCKHLNIKYYDKMLSWKKSNIKNDSWTKHWYKSVNVSTSFKSYKNENITLPEKYDKLYNECLEYFNELYQYRIL